MTDVLSSLFGRRKPKGPAPPPPPPQPSQKTNANTMLDDFVVVGNSEFAVFPQIVPGNKLPNGQSAEQSNEYESLYSFMNGSCSSKSTSPNGMVRPGRQAPPVPVPRTKYSEGPLQQNAKEVHSSAYYLSSVPFEIPKSLGGGVSYHLSELSRMLSCIKAPNLSEYEYSFHLEEQVIRENDAVRGSKLG